MGICPSAFGMFGGLPDGAGTAFPAAQPLPHGMPPMQTGNLCKGVQKKREDEIDFVPSALQTGFQKAIAGFFNVSRIGLNDWGKKQNLWNCEV